MSVQLFPSYPTLKFVKPPIKSRTVIGFELTTSPDKVVSTTLNANGDKATERKARKLLRASGLTDINKFNMHFFVISRGVFAGDDEATEDAAHTLRLAR